MGLDLLLPGAASWLFGVKHPQEAKSSDKGILTLGGGGVRSNVTDSAMLASVS